jgi:hypothetical protein
MAAKSAKERYEQLLFRRQPFLDRAREFAKLTIPSLMPPEGMSSTADLPESYQGFGSRGVINLSSRLLTAILPPGRGFFRLGVPANVIMQSEDMKVPRDVQIGLSKSETLVASEIEANGWRQPTNLVLQLLIVTGNAVEMITEDNRLRVFRLDQYVVVRDPAGKVVELIIEEKLSPASLPEDMASLVPENKRSDPQTVVCLYTQCKLNKDGKYDVRQEIEERTVPGSEGEFEKLPYRVYRWAVVPGEDYGRAKVEEHYADLRTLESLEKSLVEASALAARHVTMIRPNAAGGNLKQRLARAKNGDVISGNPEDVAMLKFDNIPAIQWVMQHAGAVAQRVAAAFMLNSGVIRDSERTTATEVRQTAEELEGTLGGVYSMLAEEMQRWRVDRLMFQMQKQGRLPDWPEDAVEPIITTGLEALGRERDLMRVQMAGQIIRDLGGEASIYVDTPLLLTTAFAALELPAAVRSEEQVAKLRQQQAMTNALEQGAGAAMASAGQAAVGQ